MNDQLAGIGQFTEGPDADAPTYRRGYLCGLIRGDGNLSVYDDARAERAGQKLHRFRLALADFEALRRARSISPTSTSYPEEFLFAAAGGAHREIRAIRDQSRAGFERITHAIAWPRGSSDLWCKGFLAGIFDAEGCYAQGVFRIANCDPEIIDWTAWSLRRSRIRLRD